MNKSIHLIKAKIECIIAKISGKPNGSTRVARIKKFSIASQTAAKTPRNAMMHPIFLQIELTSNFLPIINARLKIRHPYDIMYP